MKQKSDFFISHASEDKDEVAQQLYEKLTLLGFEVWYDSVKMGIGESLNEKINEGLSQSKYGIVILSETFLKKTWTKRELNGLFSKANGQDKVILPIYHKISYEKVKKKYPILSDIVGLNTTLGIDELAKRLKDRFDKDNVSKKKE